MSSEDDVVLVLSPAEGLVLFEFLARYGQKQVLEVQDQAEQRVLWNVLAMLERVCPEPLQADYRERLEKARAAVRDSI